MKQRETKGAFVDKSVDMCVIFVVLIKSTPDVM